MTATIAAEPRCNDQDGHEWAEEDERTPATTFEVCRRCGAKRITTVRYARPPSQWTIAKAVANTRAER
jgi:hypothetical protein